MARSNLTQSRAFRVILLAFGQGMSGVIDIALKAVLARVFLKEEYAVYIAAMLVYSTVYPILSLGLPTTTYLNLPRGQSQGRGRGVLLENQILLMALGASFSVFLLLGGAGLIADSMRNAGLVGALNVLALYFVFSLPLLALDGVLLVNGQSLTIVIFRIASQIARFLGVLIPTLVWQTPIAALAGLMIMSVVLWLVGAALMWRSTPADDWRPRFGSAWKQVLLGLPLLLATSFGALQFNLDTWLVSILGTPEQLAVFALGATELPLIGLFTAAVTQVLLADTARMFQEDKREEIARLIWSATRSNVIFLLPTMVFFLVTANSVVPLLYSDAYRESILPFTLYLLIIPARFINYSSIEIASGKTWIVPIIFGANMVLTALLTIFLYPTFSYLGATLSYLLVTYLFAVPVHLIVFTRLLKLPLWKAFPARAFARIGLAVATASLVLLLDRWMSVNDLARVLILGVLFLAALMGSYLVFGVEIPLMRAFGTFWGKRVSGQGAM